MALPDPRLIALTQGVYLWAAKHGLMTLLVMTIRDAYRRQPDQVDDGGNDKFFFSLTVEDKKLFVAANEHNGLTVMFPEEY